MATLAVWISVFLLFGSCIGAPPKQAIKQPWQNIKKWMGCPFPLDMAPNSVDDMYNGCEEKMEETAQRLLTEEKKGQFKEAWDSAEKYYTRRWAKTSTLKKEQIMAVYAYTLNEPPLYYDFNKAVRTEKSKYTTTFSYHALHFYLTMALRSLKRTAVGCVTAYRRAKCKFDRPINKEVRLGAFTSSSVGSYPPSEFGEQSCFEITTCFGADISMFSKFEVEREVLIPPYEVFKVTDIKKTSAKNPLPCEVVYKLESTRKTTSNLNCALVGSGHKSG